MAIRTLGDELHEENAQAEYNRNNRRVGKCKVCGTRHIGVIYGYCPDHQRERAEAAERECAELLAYNAALEKRVRELTAERDAANELIEGAYVVLGEGDFKNGNTDATGMIDEGEVHAGRMFEQLRNWLLIHPTKENYIRC